MSTRPTPKMTVQQALNNPQVQGIILKNKTSGDYVWKSKAQALAQQIDPDPQKIASRQLEEEKFDYSHDNVYQPLYDPEYLIRLLDYSTVHYRSVRAIAQDVSWGWIVSSTSKEDSNKNKEHPEAVPDNVRILMDFFNSCATSDETFISILQNMLIDKGTIGWGALEIGRNLNGISTKIWHLPAHTLRVCKSGDLYLQRCGTSKRYFQRFPDKCKLQRDLDTGKVTVAKWNLIDPITGAKPKSSVSPLEAATEVMFFRNYHPRSRVYGMPNVISAFGAILGNIYARDYNLDFFSENMIPAYAVIVTGGLISAPVENLIQEYFKDIRGQSRATLVLSVPGKNVEIKFERLSAEVQDSSFSSYKKENRNEIMLAHGMHPARVGIVENAQLGSGSGMSQLIHYKSSVIEPEQELLEAKVNELLIKQGFLIDDCLFKFKDLDIKDKKEECEINTRYVQSKILMPNEVRSNLGYEPKEGLDEATLKSSEESNQPMPLFKMKTSKSLPEAAAVIRLQMKQRFERDWKRLNYEKLTRDAINSQVTAIRSKLHNTGLISFQSIMYSLVSEIEKKAGVKFTQLELDMLTTKAQRIFDSYMDDAWLKDFNVELESLEELPDEEQLEQYEHVKSRMSARSALYAGLGWAFYNMLVGEAAHKANQQVYWVTTSGNPCPDCAALEAGSPYLPSSLLQMPGDGSTQCHGNCQCYLEIV